MPIEYARIVASPEEQAIYFVWRDSDREGVRARLSLRRSFIQRNRQQYRLEGWDVVQHPRSSSEESVSAYVLAPPEAVDWLTPSSTVLLGITFVNADAEDQPVGSDYALLDVEPRDSEITEGLDRVAEGISDEGVSVVRRIGGGIEDLVGFPLITGSGPDASARPSGGGGAAGSQALVDAEISGVLGRKPSADDVAGTLALLDRVMQKTETDGVERWEVRPGGAYVVARDTGAGVTGRQASLSGLARDTIEQITPLVQGVRQLAPRTDNPQLLEAARANFLASATEAAAEAGVPGGPLALKAKVLLDQSLKELGRFGVELGVLGRHHATRRYVPTRRNVVAPADEEQYTSFLIVLDRWRQFDTAFRAYLDPDARPPELFDVGPVGDDDLGLRFTLLDRRVDVIAEAVGELDAALVSVGIDRRERENIRVVPADRRSATLAEFMDWAQSFPEREARPLIQQAGIRGASLLPDRLEALAQIVRQLRKLTADPPAAANGRRPLGHPRVKVAVSKLHEELTSAKTEAHAAAHANV
jgi:hypothetical protein